MHKCHVKGCDGTFLSHQFAVQNPPPYGPGEDGRVADEPKHAATSYSPTEAG